MTHSHTCWCLIDMVGWLKWRGGRAEAASCSIRSLNESFKQQNRARMQMLDDVRCIFGCCYITSCSTCSQVFIRNQTKAFPGWLFWAYHMIQCMSNIGVTVRGHNFFLLLTFSLAAAQNWMTVCVFQSLLTPHRPHTCTLYFRLEKEKPPFHQSFNLPWPHLWSTGRSRSHLASVDDLIRGRSRWRRVQDRWS